MGLQTPHGKFPYIQLDILKREQQAGKPLILEYAHMGKSGSFQKNPFLRQQVIDPLDPFARITAAALQNKPFFILHTAKILHRDILNFHRFLLI